MTEGDIAGLIALAASFVFGATALWMLNRGLWPSKFEKRVAIAAKGAGTNLLIGIVPTTIITIIIVAAGKRLGIATIFVAAAMIAYGLAGVTGYAAIIGQRLWPESPAWQQTRNGGLVIMCSALFPIVGWFMLLPMLVVIGIGVNVRCWFTSAPRPAPATVLAEPPPLP
jgi:hypothetical protein